MLRSAASILFPLLLVTAAEAATLRVEADGSGDYPTIQSAISASANGDVIELGDGVFRGSGNRNVRPSGRRITIRSASGDPTACIIDAELATNVLRFYSDGPETVVENVGLLNGSTPSEGGGIYILGSGSPVIRGCIIAGGRSDRGGGIYVEGQNQPLLESCVFLDNEALDGGGVYATGESAIRIDGCIFAGNRATRTGGGGLWFGASSVPSISGTTVFGNETQGAGGGVFVHAHTVLDLTSSVIWGNDAPTGADLHVWDLSCQVLLSCSAVNPSAFGGFDTVVLEPDVVTSDPLFCETATTFAAYTPEAFQVNAASPCLPSGNDCGSLMGARDACAETPVHGISWGALKSRY